MSIPAEIRAALDDRSARVAVIGATDSPGKYGGIIARDLMRKGFEVLPVNPNADRVAGAPAVATAGELAGAVHIVNFVVPAAVGKQVLRALDPARFPCVWFQPGSFDAELTSYARGRFRYVIAGPCIMVEAR